MASNLLAVLNYAADGHQAAALLDPLLAAVDRVCEGVGGAGAPVARRLRFEALRILVGATPLPLRPEERLPALQLRLAGVRAVAGMPQTGGDPDDAPARAMAGAWAREAFLLSLGACGAAAAGWWTPLDLARDPVYAAALDARPDLAALRSALIGAAEYPRDWVEAVRDVHGPALGPQLARAGTSLEAVGERVRLLCWLAQAHRARAARPGDRGGGRAGEAGPPPHAPFSMAFAALAGPLGVSELRDATARDDQVAACCARAAQAGLARLRIDQTAQVVWVDALALRDVTPEAVARLQERLAALRATLDGTRAATTAAPQPAPPPRHAGRPTRSQRRYRRCYAGRHASVARHGPGEPSSALLSSVTCVTQPATGLCPGVRGSVGPVV